MSVAGPVPAVNAKQLSGSLLLGFGLVSAVLNAWAAHFFFAAFHLARAETLEATGSFDPGPYPAGPRFVQMFVGIRVLLWLTVFAGAALLAWGVWEDR